MIEHIIHNFTVLFQVSYRSQSSEKGCLPTPRTNCDYKLSYEVKSVCHDYQNINLRNNYG